MSQAAAAQLKQSAPYMFDKTRDTVKELSKALGLEAPVTQPAQMRDEPPSIEERVQNFKAIKEQDPETARAMLQQMSPEELAEFRRVLQGAPKPTDTAAGDPTEFIAQQARRMATMRGAAIAENRDPKEDPEMRKLLSAIPQELLPAFKEAYEKEIGQPKLEQHPDIGTGTRYALAQLAPENLSDEAIRGYLPEDEFDIQRGEDGIRVKRKGESEWRYVRPPLSRVSKGSAEFASPGEWGHRIAEEAPDVLGSTLAGLVYGGAGAVGASRLASVASRALTPAARMVAPVHPRTLPVVAGIGGGITGSGVGGGVYEAGRQSVAQLAGVQEGFDKPGIYGAGAVEALGSLAGPVPTFHGIGPLRSFGKSLQASEKTLQKIDSDATLNIRHMQPVRRGTAATLRTMRQILEEGSMPPSMYKDVEKFGPEYLALTRASEGRAEDQILQAGKKIMTEITRNVDKRLGTLGDELNALYRQAGGRDVRFDDIFTPYQAKAEALRLRYQGQVGKGLTDAEKAELAFYDDTIKKILGRSKIVDAVDDTGKPIKKEVRELSGMGSIREMQAFKAQLQDAYLARAIKHANQKDVPKYELEFYRDMSAAMKDRIENVVDAADKALTKVTGKQIGRSLKDVNRDYSDMLNKKFNLRNEGLYNEQLVRGDRSALDLSDFTSEELAKLSPAELSDPRQLDNRRVKKGLNNLVAVSREKDNARVLDSELKKLSKMLGGDSETGDKLAQDVRKLRVFQALNDPGGDVGHLPPPGLFRRLMRTLFFRQLSPEKQKKSLLAPYVDMDPGKSTAPPLVRPFTRYPLRATDYIKRGASKEMVDRSGVVDGEKVQEGFEKRMKESGSKLRKYFEAKDKEK